MAESHSGSDRTVTLSPEASLDVSAAYVHTAQLWGIDQSERYNDFLDETMRRLADKPTLGRAVADRSGIRSFVARWPGAQHEHRIVYREVSDSIYVLRVLHTAMDWPASL